jgi:hypothetical protein
MKKIMYISVLSILFLSITYSFILANNSKNKEVLVQDSISKSDKAALLYMLEEEKLARDTYTFLNEIWSINQFSNIKKSEQRHMDAIENLLIKNKISYSILPSGKFANKELQDYYNTFIKDGSKSKSNALQIGATIEDLDIVDLEKYINATKNAEIISVFRSLQCGSRNHIKAFLRGIENGGNSYSPKFLSQKAFQKIIDSDHEHCN